MDHFPRTATISVPVTALVYDGTAPKISDTANTLTSVICLDNFYGLDFADNTLKATPGTATSANGVPTLTGFTNAYYKKLVAGAWPRGHYLAKTRNSTLASDYFYDFSLGLYIERKLGYSAAYTGSILTLSVWVEEQGLAQTDYVSLASVRIYDSAGTVITGGTLADNAAPSNGVFRFITTIALSPSTNYLFSCIASVAGPATTSNHQFPLRFGFARP